MLDGGHDKNEARALSQLEKKCEKRFCSTAGKHLVYIIGFGGNGRYIC